MALADIVFGELEKLARRRRDSDFGTTLICSEDEVCAALKRNSYVPTFRFWQGCNYWLIFSEKSDGVHYDRLAFYGPHGDNREYLVQRSIGDPNTDYD